MSKIYSYEDVLGKVKQKQLYILDNVVKICEKHNLKYWLDAGTLLGAIRHKGFIPWDDDIDIGLMRKDYELLIKILPDELSSDLILQTVDSDIKYGLMFAKVRDVNSHIYDEVEYEYNGVFIDIFPFDHISGSILIQKFQYRIVSIMTSYSLSKSFSKGRHYLIKRVIEYILNHRYLYITIYNLVLKLSNIKKDKNFISNGIVCPWAFYTSVREKETYVPTSFVKFENKEYRAPNNFDKYLKSLYGEDYMTPLKSKHVAHIEKISFKTSIDTWLSE